jgi:hypothetical protein
MWVGDPPHNSVSVLINDGNGTFAARVDYVTGVAPVSVAVGDMNGDGKLDLAVANSHDGTASVLLNNGDGTFAAKLDYGTGDWPNSVDVGDLNGDGTLDMVIANRFSDTVSVLLNTCLPAPSCDDGSPCTTGDHWDPIAQSCVYTTANEGGACGNAGTCASGKCTEPLGVSVWGTGGGTVMSGIGAIKCPSACAASIELGRQVTLYATPTAGSSFAGWSGDCTGKAPCVLQMTASRNVTAMFTTP